jgi:hypothetical protein
MGRAVSKALPTNAKPRLRVKRDAFAGLFMTISSMVGAATGVCSLQTRVCFRFAHVDRINARTRHCVYTAPESAIVLRPI